MIIKSQQILQFQTTPFQKFFEFNKPMSSLFSYFLPGTGKHSQTESNTPIVKCLKSEVKFQEIDCIDQDEDQKNQQQPKKTLTKQQPNQQKSISSGDFQEITENDDSNTKQSKIKNQVEKEMQESCVQINMEDTLQFKDQINQSISESHLLKKPLKNPIRKTVQQSFSDINEYNETQENQKQDSHENKVEPENNNYQYPSISGSFKSGDFNKQMEESFEDFSTKYSISKQKNSTVTSETVAQCLDYLGFGNNVSLPKNEENQDEQEVKDKKIFTFVKKSSKIEQQQNAQEEVNEKKDTDSQDDIFDVNKSLFAQKIKPIGHKNNEKKTSPTKQKNTKQGQFFNKQQKIDNDINVQESYYMAKIQQKPIRLPSTKNQDSQKFQPLKKGPFTIYLKDSLFFIKYGQTPDRRLTDKIFQALTQTFLVKNIMLPFFNLKLLEDHENQIQIGVKKQKEELFSIYANIYFEFLHKKYQRITKQFFQKQIEKFHTKSKIIDSQIGLKKDEASPIFGTFYKKVIDYFKLSHYSKAQILKDSLQSELSFILQFSEKWTQSEQQSPQVSQNHKEVKAQLMNKKILSEKSFYLLNQIGGIQLLLSFQKSEMYCEDKLKEKLQENIWRERKKKLIQDRNWFISHLFTVCQV